MFEIASQLLTQLIDLIPGLFAIYVVFDLLGSLIFSKR